MWENSRNGDSEQTSVLVGTSIYVFPYHASLFYIGKFCPVHCGVKSVNTKNNRWSSQKGTWINLEELGGRISDKKKSVYSHDLLWNKEMPIVGICGSDSNDNAFSVNTELFVIPKVLKLKPFDC